MARKELDTAADHLSTASESTDDVDTQERLIDLADQLETLSDRSKGPDHGRLARIQNALSDLKDDVSEDTSAAIDSAKDEISAYRETIEGV